MKNLLFLFCFLTASVHAQDSISLKLIPDPEPVSIQKPWIPPTEPWWPRDPWWPIELSWFTPTYSFVWITPACGDTYHENGQLSSRIECVDSVMHGKAIYWDETGHKTTELTYAEGHLIKSKYYDSRGRLTSLAHYDYRGNYQGVYVEYTYDYQADPVKTVTHYDHGIKHGALENYVNNILTSKELYNHDNLLESFTYFEDGEMATHDFFSGQYTIESRRYGRNGQLIFLEKTDTTGAYKTYQEWDEQGVLLKENKFEAFKPVGTFLDYHDTANKIKKFTHYENGLPVKAEEFKDDFLQAEIFYEQGIDTYTIGWFENGDTAFFYERQPRGYFRKKWNPEGDVISAFSYVNSHLITGNAFYMRNDTAYYIVSTENPSENIPIVQWVVYNGDTLRMDYIRNGTALEYQPREILVSNHFIYDANQQKQVRHGVWKYYDNNQLKAVITYNYGVREGREVYYTTTKNSSELYSFGYVANDKRQGEWTTFSIAGKILESYEDGLLNGEVKLYDTSGNLVSIITYANNERNGPAITYQNSQHASDLTEKTREFYENGKLHGPAIYYDSLNRIESQGNYEDGTRVNTWYFYGYDSDGKVKRTRIHYRNKEVVI